MINDPSEQWSKHDLNEHLSRINQLIQSEEFLITTPYTSQSQRLWVELIRAVSDLVRQALLAGKRINFTQEVNPHQPKQDITSLLEIMRQSAYVIKDLLSIRRSITVIYPQLNHCYGPGSGYFTNGLFFACPYQYELAFFIGSDRIYFYRHLLRAFTEARRFLQARS